MPIIDLFSKRQKRINGQVSDVYTYDKLPNTFRVQIVHIWKDLLGDEVGYERHPYNVSNAYKNIVELLRREYGLFELVPSKYNSRTYIQELSGFILSEQDIERCLDSIELTFKYANAFCRKFDYQCQQHADENVDNCIIELNHRFKEHGIGYEFYENEIIRIDSQLIHNEAVKPALFLLNRSGFEGPRDEFLSAYEHFRHKKYKEALNDALKSFESTIKVICSLHSWQYDPSSTSAKKLINTCITNGLFPSYYQNHLTALATLLESGVPTIRNKEGGHGQGENIKEVDPCVVSYTLHMTASAIVLLGELEKNISP